MKEAQKLFISPGLHVYPFAFGRSGSFHFLCFFAKMPGAARLPGVGRHFHAFPMIFSV
jgi:hypothetical protein